MKTLVTICNYRAESIPYLREAVKQYQHMPHKVDIHVFVKHSEDLGLADITIHRDSPYEGWLFHWTPRPLILENANDYDLFIGSDDDVLITHRHIRAFLQESGRLPVEYIPGFLVVERNPLSGRWYTINMHTSFHPAIRDYHEIQGRAYFTPINLHSAMFMATQRHMQRAIDSGHYSSTPRNYAEYGLGTSEMAISNIYVDCEMTKVIPCDNLTNFCIHHLPNRIVQLGGNFNGHMYSMDAVRDMIERREHESVWNMV